MSRESFKHLVEGLQLGNSGIELTFEVTIHAEQEKELWGDGSEIAVWRVTDLDFGPSVQITHTRGAWAEVELDKAWEETILGYWDTFEAEEVANDYL